ncbi:MAG: hypothetical protein K6F00_04375 [Lachnospiraceae bacterium]|nr:hypothetical protein [Lachnospiraceae bacterium]
MKDKLIRFRLPIIVLAVILVFVIAAVILRSCSGSSGKGEVSEYFSGSRYPVTAEVKENGTVLIMLDGSVTPDLSWTILNENEDMCEVKAKSAENNGVLTVSAKPLGEGYSSIYFSRECEISGETYVVAKVHAEILSYEDDNGDLKSQVSDIYLDSANAGALDTDTPFMIENTRIILPKGGDWEVIETTADGGKSAGVFGIYPGKDSKGIDFIDIFPTVEEAIFEFAMSDDVKSPDTEDEEESPAISVRNARLMLRSESLGLSFIYTYMVNENGYGELKPSDEEIELKPVEETEASPADAEGQAAREEKKEAVENAEKKDKD